MTFIECWGWLKFNPCIDKTMDRLYSHGVSRCTIIQCYFVVVLVTLFPLGVYADILSVPGTNTGPGTHWYRAWVKVPDKWSDLSGRPLWYESVTLQVNELPGAHEVFINDQRVGGAGSFAPDYKDGFETFSRYKVPPGSLKKGMYNVITIRNFMPEGEGGFRGPAPIIAGYFLEAKLTGEWEIFRGEKPAWTREALAEKPGHAVYDEFAEASSVLKRPDALFSGARLTPEESLKTFTVNDPNFELELLLSEPQIAQPLQMSFDARGRLWLVEYRQYPYPAGLNVISRDRFYRSIYHRMPDPPPHHVRGSDRVSIHEDTDGDGQFDAHKVFVDGLNMVTAVAPGGDGVWMLNGPYLLFWPDKDQDDVPDGNPEVRLSGFGMQDTHSLVNSLRWGPDGWLYACHGSTISSQISGHVGETAYIEGPAVWRYHPKTRRFEFFGIGGGNLFSLEFDSAGQVFSGYNGGNTRGFHFRQGAYYTKGARGKYGPAANPYAFGQLEPMAHTSVPRFTHSFVIYESAVLSAEYHQNLFCIDPLHRRVVRAVREQHGSTFRTRDVGFTLECSDPAFRPVDIKVGQDGALYIADFYEYYIAHGQHFQGQIDPSSGRVYRLRPKNRNAHNPENLGTASPDRLFEMLSHSDRWHREMALRMIAERKVGGRDAITNLVTEEGSLYALWAMYQRGWLDVDSMDNWMAHEQPEVRAWTLQLAAESGRIHPQIMSKLVNHPPLTAVEAVQWASVIQRLGAEQARPLVATMLRAESSYMDDPHVPHMLWWAIEKHVAADPEAMVDAVLSGSAPPQILEKLARRLIADGQLREAEACVRLFDGARGIEAKDAVKRGMVIEVRARPELYLPTEVLEILKDEAWIGDMIALRKGEPEAVERALALLENKMGTDAQRAQVMEQLSKLQHVGARDRMIMLAYDEKESLSLRKAAVTALGEYTDSETGHSFLERVPEDIGEVTKLMLMSRSDFAWPWLKMAHLNLTPAAVFSELEAEVLSAHGNKKLDAMVQPRVVSSPSVDAPAEVARLIEIVNRVPGNPYKGRNIYRNMCGTCHQLFQMGGDIGPNLTGYPREDLSLLLFHVVDPSAEIREGYGVYLVKTDDQRIRYGFVEDEDAGGLVLVDMEGQRHRILREQVAEQRLLPYSLMPQGLLQALPDQSLRDLVAYLRAGQPMVKD